MTFKELLDSMTFQDVAPHLIRLYPNIGDDLLWYKFHFDMLRLMTPCRHDDANSDVCLISIDDCNDGTGPHITAYPMEGDYWEHSLTKQIVLQPGIEATNPEIAACCLWHTSFCGFSDEQRNDIFRVVDGIDPEAISRWDDFTYYREISNRFCSIIRKHGGVVPAIRELSPFKKKELLSDTKRSYWCSEEPVNRLKRLRGFRREYMAHYYERIMHISRFIVQAIQVSGAEQAPKIMDSLCSMFMSTSFYSEKYQSYADETTDSAQYLLESLESYSKNAIRYDNMIVILTTGVQHETLTTQEQSLCNYMTAGCQTHHVILATDESLGRQMLLNYATYTFTEPTK